jgi:hypothetical protein
MAMTDHIMVPVAAGELYDKLSILEIKLERIGDPEKRANVQLELDLLNEIAGSVAGGSDAEVAGLRAELKTVNEAIWEAENVVRRIARAGTFGEEFAAVARLTYSNNDRRAAIKRKLSLLCGSSILEEKSHEDAGSQRLPR